MELNQCTFVGNLTRDPESRQTQNSSVCKFGLAVNSRRGKEEETLFLTVEAWGKTGELCDEYLRKGDQALVSGRIKLDEYESKDGDKKQSLVLVAERVSFGAKAGDSKRDDDRSSKRDDRGRDRRDDDRGRSSSRGGRASNYDD